MKKIGIVGGLGPESTLDYYRGIIDGFKSMYDSVGYPEIGVESLNLKAVMGLIQRDDWDTIADLIAHRFEALRNCGAGIGAIASNTPHKVFQQIQDRTRLPLVSIVEATCEQAVKAGLKTLCLLGTQVTMSGNYYQKVFDRHQIRLVVPNEQEQQYIQEKLFTEIEFGTVTTDTRRQFIQIVNRIQSVSRVEGLVLGCTELPLVIRAEDIEIQYLDTTALHVAKIVEQCQQQ